MTLRVFRNLVRRQARNLNQRPDFDRANARSGNSAGDVDRIAEILRFNEEVAGNLLLGLDERAVAHDRLIVAHSDNGSGRCRL